MKKKWWHDKTAYQIYPKSFQDTNGDGIGDLRGIINRLDYIKDLGVEIVWLSPIYCSPLADQGYDISDYYNIDPRFGTMEEMEELLAEAKKRGIHIIMDLVVNHCSDEHEWFKKAMEDPDGEYGDYFYIREGKDGKPPTNWRSYFGGSAWEPIPGTDKYYLHVFHKKQPDLNWENLKVRQEIYDMMNWWMEKGLAGFRVDAIINIKKPAVFRDYPADRDDGMSSLSNMLGEAQGVGDLLKEMRLKTVDRYDGFTAGEVFNMQPEQLEEFIGEEGHFSTIFDFTAHSFGFTENGWYDSVVITPEDYKKCIFQGQRQSEPYGFYANIIENHDEPRGVSYYIPDGECSEQAKKMLAGVYFLLRGIPFIYQGQEIGMENIEVHSIDEVDDVSAREEYRVAIEAGLSEEEALKVIQRKSRDNARTPFHWDDTANAGFTTGEPWLQVNPNYTRINAASQIEDETSVLSFYKKLMALRSSETYKEAVVYGEFEAFCEEEKNLIGYYRKGKDKTILVLANFQSGSRKVVLEQDYKKVILNNSADINAVGKEILLEGYQLLVLEL